MSQWSAANIAKGASGILLFPWQPAPDTAGIAIGALASVLAVKAIRSQLFGIDSLDPVALQASIVILAAAAWFAAWLPARRAGRVDPATLLRGD